MSNDVNPQDSGEGAVPPAGPADFAIPSHWVLEDIGHGYVLLHPPGRLDDVPFPPDDPDRVADYEWAQNDPEMQARYGGLVVAVRHKHVWGVGRSHAQAGQEALARPDCPRDLVYVYVWPVSPDEGNGRPKA